ncbi:MAG TPA: helix-turn-helix domain-containing protein [Dehalococcoidia bacterium]|nr:helix-turn-helix domain-containing protein [Dehalococcoidia bacterium]
MTTHGTRYLTVAEAAARLRVSRPTVWRWIDSGLLPAYRVGARSIRIREEDIERVVSPVIEAMRRPEASAPPRQASDDPEGLLRKLRQMHADQRARRGGRPLPSSVSLIRKAREER